jgi:hypothetical protein
MLQDEELARPQAEAAWAARKNKAAPEEAQPPPLREWSPVVDMLAGVVDRQGSMISSIYAAQGVKPPKIRPLPRPETAFERLMRQYRDREKRRIHESIVAAVLPNRGPD